MSYIYSYETFLSESGKYDGESIKNFLRNHSNGNKIKHSINPKGAIELEELELEFVTRASNYTEEDFNKEVELATQEIVKALKEKDKKVVTFSADNDLDAIDYFTENIIPNAKKIKNNVSKSSSQTGTTVDIYDFDGVKFALETFDDGWPDDRVWIEEKALKYLAPKFNYKVHK